MSHQSATSWCPRAPCPVGGNRCHAKYCWGTMCPVFQQQALSWLHYRHRWQAALTAWFTAPWLMKRTYRRPLFLHRLSGLFWTGVVFFVCANTCSSTSQSRVVFVCVSVYLLSTTSRVSQLAGSLLPSPSGGNGFLQSAPKSLLYQLASCLAAMNPGGNCCRATAV